MDPYQLQQWERQQLDLAQQVVQSGDGCLSDLSALQLVGGLDISFFPEPCAAASSQNPAAQGASDAPSCPSAPAAAAQLRAPGSAEGAAGPEAAEAQQPARPQEGAALQGGGAAAGRAAGALAVVSFPGLQLRHAELLEARITVPYAPGFLGFREVPTYLELLRRAAAKGIHPQLLLVDGFGVLHPRRCGSASHLGVLSGLPTVGVAKNLLAVEGLLQKQVRAAVAAATGCSTDACAPAAAAGAVSKTPAPVAGPGLPAAAQPPPTAAAAAAAAGCVEASSSGGGGGGSSSGGGSGGGGGGGERDCGWLPLVGASGELFGAAVCAAPGSKRPIYVSVGHRASLGAAVEVVRRCCLHRVPEPIRQADLLSRAEVRRLQRL